MRPLLTHDALRNTDRVSRIRPRIATALALTALVAPGSALAGAGGSSSILTLLGSIAGHSRELAGLLDTTNTQMTQLETDLGEINALDAQMATLVDQTATLGASTDELGTSLGDVRERIELQGATLATVSKQVRGLGKRMNGVRSSVAGQLATRQAMGRNFDDIAGKMGGMITGFDRVIAQMGFSAPAVRRFAGNDLLLAYPGGDPTRYGLLNLAPTTPVMSIMLPMITTLQRGGPLIANKVSQTSDSPLVGALLASTVPDGTNTGSTVLRYDGKYGLPAPSWFLRNRVAGF